MAFSFKDPSGYALTEKDMSIIRPAYEGWLQEGNKGTLQHYISNTYFADVPSDNEKSFDWDNAPVIKSKFSRDPFDNVPVIGSKLRNDMDDSYARLETFGASKTKTTPKFGSVIQSKFSRDPFDDIPVIGSKLGNDMDDSYDRLETFGTSKTKPKIGSSSSFSTNQIPKPRSVSFLETAKSVKMTQTTPYKKVAASASASAPTPSKKVTASASSLTQIKRKTFDEEQQKRAIGHLKPYMSKNCSVETLFKKEADFKEFQSQIGKTVEQLSRPKSQKLDVHPITHDLININAVVNLRTKGGEAKELKWMKQAGIILSTMDHETFKKRATAPQTTK